MSLQCEISVHSYYFNMHPHISDWLDSKENKEERQHCLLKLEKKKKRICDLGANTIAFYQVAMSRWKKSNKSTFTNQEQVAVAPQLGIFNNWKRDTVGADWGKKRYIDYRIDELTQEGEREKETHWEKEGLYG